MKNTSRKKFAILALAVMALLAACGSGGGSGSGGSTSTTSGTNPAVAVAPPPPANIGESALMFVTSVPSSEFDHQLNTFGNHLPTSPPGGDLYIRYADGKLRNLTAEAGFGVGDGIVQAGDKAIAVRQPTMHWGGEKAIFSMQVGGATKAYEYLPNRHWQMYEVTGLGKDQKVEITKVVGQPPDYNNVSPIYGSDDQILFTSDKPLYGMTHTYPQLDEYESTAVVSGIWKLNPKTNEVVMIEHSPSGVFDLHLDSYGRVLFTKWDHLKRDQQADLTRYSAGPDCTQPADNDYDPFDFADEAVDAVRTKFKLWVNDVVDGKRLADDEGVLYDLFPEARNACDPTRDDNEPLHDFNQFMIWQINEDGSEEETINHSGRNEFGGTYLFPMFLDDPLLLEGRANEGIFSKNQVLRDTVRGDAGIFQLREDVKVQGLYHGTYAMEFGRQSAGRIFEFDMKPTKNPEDMVVTDYTNAFLDAVLFDATKTELQTGHYRDSLKLFSDAWVVSHTTEHRLNRNDSPDPATSKPRYVFQIKNFAPKFAGSSEYVAGVTPLTGGINKKVIYWTGAAYTTTYDGPLNETDVIEVRGRKRPTARSMKIDPIEAEVLQEEKVDEAELRNWLKLNNLALIVTRNMTIRDRADTAQPFNLRVPGGVENIPTLKNPATKDHPNGTPAKVYDIQDLQIFQGDLTRSYGSEANNPKGKGRRVFSKPMHNSAQQKKLMSQNLTNKEALAVGVTGSVKIGLDGSTAAFVPAGRALTWQVTSPAGKPVLRERNWLTFAPGEIRTCASCHGVNKESHNGSEEPTNRPQALRDLMAHWKGIKDKP